jgi:hypothetical protein
VCVRVRANSFTEYSIFFVTHSLVFVSVSATMEESFNMNMADAL